MFGCIQDTLVVVVDNLFSAIHATVTDLDGIAVEDFSEFVLFREVFVYTNIGHRFLTLVDKHFPKENKLRVMGS